MPEYDKINGVLNMSLVLKMPKFWIWERSGYDRVLNMRALHSNLNMSEYALTEFWRDLRF